MQKWLLSVLGCISLILANDLTVSKIEVEKGNFKSPEEVIVFLDSIDSEIKKGSRVKLFLEDSLITSSYYGLNSEKNRFLLSKGKSIDITLVKEFSYINDRNSSKLVFVLAPIIGGIVGLGVERAVHKNRDDEDAVRRSRGISFNENETSQIDFFGDIGSPLLAFTGGAMVGLASGFIVFDVKNRETVSLSVSLPIGSSSK